MINRSMWVFVYETAVVFAAAQTKQKHHEARAKFWKDEFRKADNEWRQSEEAFKSTQGFDSTYSNQPLQTRVQECRNNARSHDQKAKEYEKWTRVLAQATMTHLDLNIDDITYFGIVTDGVGDE